MYALYDCRYVIARSSLPFEFMAGIPQARSRSSHLDV